MVRSFVSDYDFAVVFACFEVVPMELISQNVLAEVVELHVFVCMDDKFFGHVHFVHVLEVLSSDLQ